MTTQLEFVNIVSEITQVLSPGSLSLHLSRFDSPVSNPHPTVYNADRDYFRVHPGRNLLLREAVEGEFDAATPSSDEFFPEEYPTLKLQKADAPGTILSMVRSRIPRLWMLVTKLGPNTHQVVTVYRGKGLMEDDRSGSA